jgi:hypothetical protein
MSTYPLAELLRRYDRGDLTAEQTAGHLLQHLEMLSERVAELEKRVRQLEQPSAPHGY